MKNLPESVHITQSLVTENVLVFKRSSRDIKSPIKSPNCPGDSLSRDDCCSAHNLATCFVTRSLAVRIMSAFSLFSMRCNLATRKTRDSNSEDRKADMDPRFLVWVSVGLSKPLQNDAK
jgi:hypothetical protein